MPFITEELWAIKGEEGAGATRSWRSRPGRNSMRLIDPASEAEIGWVVDLVNEVRSARSETNVPAGAQIPLVLVAPSANVQARADRWDDH